MPLTVCLLVVPIVIALIYIGTYATFAAKLTEINGEVANIPRYYIIERERERERERDHLYIYNIYI